MRRKHILAPAMAGAVALALVGGVSVASAMRTHDVTLSVDGNQRALDVREDTVADVLQLEGIELGAHDVVLPAKDTEVTDGLAITVRHARPLQLTVDGKERKVWTTARTVDEALGYLSLGARDSKLSTSRSAAIGRDGLDLEVVTAKDVTLVAGGKQHKVRLAGTVGDLLAKQGVKPDGDDIVSPAASTMLTDGMQVKFVDVRITQSNKDVAVPHDKTTKKSAKLDKGEEKVTTEGVDGVKRERIREVFHDGKRVESKKVGESVVKKAVTEVMTVGTKEPEKTEKKADASSKRSTTSSSSDSKSSSQDLSPAVGNSCKASYYWDPQPTANGEQFDTNAFTAAHKSLPFNTRVKVTNKANGKSTIVRINDRGPYVGGRCLDLSTAAMKAIGGVSSGVVSVNWEVVG
ncbi:septal ring lytic transglycosylase RlpA family protein [uncultured Tessaracoccus sp.]|uniref:septal ring lytic transglycosylase RlpA family protein n=1 Tax=uncultured Tessaracoccus sp. TaxID=905023 RepID=UPI0025FEE6D8|nr:septal ring lytic transglycosylase RlpA family protein [uncultured Tessaracoccus sp.]